MKTIANFLRLFVVMAASLALAGCLYIDGDGPVISTSDLAILPDYSGIYIAYTPDQSQTPDNLTPEEGLLFVDLVEDGIYRLATSRTRHAEAEFFGYLYLLDIGSETEAIGIVAPTGTEPEDSMILFIRKDSGEKFDLFYFNQTNSDLYAALLVIAASHGMALDPDDRGHIVGETTSGELLSAYFDPGFLPLVNRDFFISLIRQDGLQPWPTSLEFRPLPPPPLALLDDRPGWRAEETETASGIRCTLRFGLGSAPAANQLVIHAIGDEIALETSWPDLAPRTSVAGLKLLRWKIDGQRTHRLRARRDPLDDSILIVRPFTPKLLLELARGNTLRLASRGLDSQQLDLRGSARATDRFLQCVDRN